MADTRVQLQVEDWVRENWMLNEFGLQFSRKRLRLTTGGVFDFDAVSDDKKIVATISTSGARTSSGKRGAGKLFKIRSDIYFLLLINVERRLVVLTEQDMYDLCQKEKEVGRVPLSIEFIRATIPTELADRLARARQKAADEVTPSSQE